MNDLIPMLKLTATHLEMDHMATMATAAREAVAVIERLAAENAALRAKVERLTLSDVVTAMVDRHKARYDCESWSDAIHDLIQIGYDHALASNPKAFAEFLADAKSSTPQRSPQEACDVLNKHRHLGSCEWHVRANEWGSNVWMGDSATSRTANEAFYIAQGLERDAKGGGE